MKHFMIATSLFANIITMIIIGQQYWNNENTMKKVHRVMVLVQSGGSQHGCCHQRA